MADQKAREEILKFAKEQQDETLRERREGIEGQLFELIYKSYLEVTYPTVKDLAEEINKNTKYPLSERKIANLIRKVLELNVRRIGHDNITSVDLKGSTEKVKELCEYFGMEFKETDQSSLEAGEIFQGL